jgi:hypothetical protein
MGFFDDAWERVKGNPIDPIGIFNGGGPLGGGGGGGGDPYSGQIPYPTYIGMDPAGLQINNNFRNAPMQKFQTEAMRSGPSAGTQFALKQNAFGANRGRDQARRAAGGMAENAEAALSMKGGLGAGAKERIQQYATDVGMEGMNAADANASGSRANLLVADEAARVGQLGQASNMQAGQNAFDYNLQAQNLGRQQGEYDRRNMFNMNNYNERMRAWAAGKQAQATADSGKKS